MADPAVRQKLREIFSGLMIHQGKPARVIIRLFFGFFGYFFFNYAKSISWQKLLVRSHDSATQPSLLLLLPQNIKYHPPFEFIVILQCDRKIKITKFGFKTCKKLPTLLSLDTFHAIYKKQLDSDPTCSRKS